MSATTEEPIRTFSRSAQYISGSIYANLPTLAAQQLDIDSGDELAVEVYRDRVVIHR